MDSTDKTIFEDVPDCQPDPWDSTQDIYDQAVSPPSESEQLEEQTIIGLASGSTSIPMAILKDEKEEPWQKELIPSGRGKPAPILANVLIALRRCPAWQGVLAFNEFSLAIDLLKPTPWGKQPGSVWTDEDNVELTCWIQQKKILAPLHVVKSAVRTVAGDCIFHPVRDYFDELTWDRKVRLDTWLSVYLGVEQTNYSAAIGARWLISLVARIYQPGIKADCCLLLEGPQGIKKSTALRTLALKDDWFSDQIPNLHDKDAAIHIRGKLIIEFAELDKIRGAAWSAVKAFFSRNIDRYRPVWGTYAVDVPRQCVFSGSVNDSTYLEDETGNRRFWPVQCGTIDLVKLKRDVRQLIAEAIFRYRRGDIWWIDSNEFGLMEDAEQEQANRYEKGQWDDIIEQWMLNPIAWLDETERPVDTFLSTTESTTTGEVLLHCLKRQTDKWTQKDKISVCKCLRHLGYEYHHDKIVPAPEFGPKFTSWRWIRKNSSGTKGTK